MGVLKFNNMDDNKIADKENDFGDFMNTIGIDSLYITFGTILILLWLIFCVKCCARDKRRKAKRNLERMEAESLAWSTARAAAARSAANQIVHQNVIINVNENNKIMNNVNINESDLAQLEPKPRKLNSFLNRNVVINNNENKNNYDEFELDKIELEPDADY